jgi:hypothetical protein
MSLTDLWAEQERERAEHAAILADLSEHDHVLHGVDFGLEGDIYDQADAEGNEGAQAARSEVSLEVANAISSAIREPDRNSWATYRHTVALDIDHRVRVVPSSTPGNGHLYIDVPMEWEQYEKLLKVLAEVGIIEEGYAGASIRRRATHLRLPWVRKPCGHTDETGRVCEKDMHGPEDPHESTPVIPLSDLF